jgi:uncharacterized protein YbaA (DUF1428 family)
VFAAGWASASRTGKKSAFERFVSVDNGSILFKPHGQLRMTQFFSHKIFAGEIFSFLQRITSRYGDAT